MLNELKVLVNSVEELGEELEPLHRDLSRPGGKEALRILLNEDASIKSLEYVNTQQLSQDILELKSSNHDRFPGFRLDFPLRGEKSNIFYSSLQEYRNAKKIKKDLFLRKFEEVCEKENEVPGDWIELKDYEIAKRMIEKYPHCVLPEIKSWPNNKEKIKQRAEIFSKANEENVQIYYELYRRYLNFRNNGLDLLALLDRKASELLYKGCDENQTKLLMNILFGEKSLEAKKKKNKKVLPESVRTLLVLDYFDEKSMTFATSINSKKEKGISNCLKQSEMKENSASKKYQCPIVGESKFLIDDKFPQINLGKGKPVSQIIPYSKFDNKGRCDTVKRYGKSGVESYTIDQTLSQKIRPLLEKLTDKVLKNQTWCSIPSEIDKKYDLLIGYCRSCNDCSVIAPIIKLPKGFKKSKERVADVIALYNRGDLTPDSLVDFFVFRKISDGVQKIIYSTMQPVERLYSARQNWKDACNNFPFFKLVVKIEKEIKRAKPFRIEPIELIPLSRQSYKRDGSESEKNTAISFSDAMKLFFDIENNQKELVKRLLNKVVIQNQFLFSFCRLTSLFSSFKKDIHNAPGEFKKSNYERNKIALQITTLICNLLYRLNRRKEDYMNEYSYQLGQLFSAMDEVHIGYCMHIRKGRIPATLLGNACYSIALQNPSKALGIFAERLQPYSAWADKVEHDEALKKLKEERAIKNAVYALRWIKKELASTLHSHFNNNPTTVTHKAELMLGYLAGRPFLKSSNTNETITSQENSNENK